VRQDERFVTTGAGRRFEVKFLARCRSISKAPISGLPLDRHLREHRLVPIDIIVNDDSRQGCDLSKYVVPVGDRIASGLVEAPYRSWSQYRERCADPTRSCQMVKIESQTSEALDCRWHLQASILKGTEGSNPPPSSGGSGTNLTSTTWRAGQRRPSAVMDRIHRFSRR
jgi:hypothetical protein